MGLVLGAQAGSKVLVENNTKAVTETRHIVQIIPEFLTDDYFGIKIWEEFSASRVSTARLKCSSSVSVDDVILAVKNFLSTETRKAQDNENRSLALTGQITSMSMTCTLAVTVLEFSFEGVNFIESGSKPIASIGLSGVPFQVHYLITAEATIGKISSGSSSCIIA